MHFLETLLMDIMKSEIIVPKYLNTLILPYWWADQLASTLLVGVGPSSITIHRLLIA